MLFDEQGRGCDYVFLETNASFDRTTGLTNAVGLRMRHFAPNHEQHWFDIYGQVALTGEPVRFEQEARALGRWYGVYAFRLGGEESRQVAVLFEDISTRKKSELRRSFLTDLAERLSYLREDAAIIAATVTALGQFMNVDRCYFTELTAAGKQVVLSENFVRGGTTSLSQTLELNQFGGEFFWENISRGALVEDVTSHPWTRENTRAYTSIGVSAFIAQPYRDAGHASILLLVTESTPRVWTPDEKKLVEDVVARVWPMVERARSERALVEAHAELEQRVIERTAGLRAAIADLEAYSYGISHDLRAPLRAMQTYAGILAEECGEKVGEEGREHLRRIMAASERMDRLIRDVLVFSRTATAESVLEPVDLSVLTEEVIDTYPALSALRDDIVVRLPLGAAEGNPAALTQCLANLLGNAIKFVAPQVRPKVEMWSEVIGDRLRLYVRDNGVGIAPELHEKIFGVFYRGHTSIDASGTGIGLAIVRKAVERMGGRVGLESAVGAGSTFWLDLKRSADV